MKKIELPMKVHAVKLEYKRQQLEKMVHGYYRVIRGKKNVVVTYDPDHPKYTKTHPRILSVTTKIGKAYSEMVSNYQKLNSEYNDLLNEWSFRYGIDPPKVVFPIVQFYDPHSMNNDYFNRQAENTGKYQSDNPTVSDNGEFKSKNEQFGADLLVRMDIPFKYEPSIYLPSNEETINPDFIVNFYEIDRCSYLEIIGMSDKVDYMVRNATKINGFSKDKYRPGREIIYVILYDKQNFDEDYFVSQVLSAFNDMIPDSALIWDAGKQVV